MTNAQFDVNAEEDQSGEQAQHETHEAHLGAIEKRLGDLLRTVPQIVVNQRHINSLEELRLIVKGFRTVAAERVRRDRTPDA